MDPRVKECAGRTSVCSLHKVCETGRASPYCAGRTDPVRIVRARPTRIATPN